MSDHPLGDMPVSELRDALHAAADLAADYLAQPERYPVLPPTVPGDVAAALATAPPDHGEPFDALLGDYRSLVEPNLTHWNHPGFLAYFAITGSGPGIVAELLAATLNVNAMLWRTAPAATELEERVCDWLRQMLDLPPAFSGHINDTASIASLLALAAARHRATGDFDLRRQGLTALPPLTVYCSDQAHSSIDKAMLTLGQGLGQLRRLPCNERFELRVDALRDALAADRAAGRRPVAVVATAGTTSTNAIDPLAELADVCATEGLWLHVDAAYGGAAAICPELRPAFAGLERADSVVVNPHKWLFTPFDCSVMLVRDAAALRAAFALVPDYLRTSERDVTNLMDYGPQLGRRFRALKLWFVIRYFGVRGLRDRIRAHCSLARWFADQVAAHAGFERLAPTPLSTVCFRVTAPGADEAALNALNERVLARVNADGRVFLSHTVLGGRYTIRLTVGNLRTTRAHVAAAWELLQAARTAEVHETRRDAGPATEPC